MTVNNILILERSSNNVTISEFVTNDALNKYNYRPSYQRKGNVWDKEQKSFFIDSIMKNYPIPPIFLRIQLDNIEGTTTYDVIDGKQRLSTIKDFVEGRLHLPENFGDDGFGNTDLNGLSFNQIKQGSLKGNNTFKIYLNSFWKYALSIEYISNEDDEIVRSIFDRLNRNGYQLNEQELRHAKSKYKNIITLIKQLELVGYWKNDIKSLSETRMQNDEFISELLFSLVENEEVDSDPKKIDGLYEKWSQPNKFNLLSQKKALFIDITNYLASLDIKYDYFKINGPSHIYALWRFSYYCMGKNYKLNDVKSFIKSFFSKLRGSEIKDTYVQQYKESMSSRTKSRSQRKKRIQALKDSIGIFCGE